MDMTETWFVLRLPQQNEKEVNVLRKTLFQMTGEPTTRFLPPVVLLGKTSMSSLPRMVKAPRQGIINQPPVFRNGQLILPVTGFEELAAELGIPDGIRGIYLCSRRISVPSCTFHPIDDFRLALLETRWEQEQVRWSFLSERRLWKGKA